MHKKLAISMAIFAAVFVFASCSKKQAIEPANQENNNQNQGQQEEIDISNWKIYRNEEMGFEMKYPEEFSDIIDKDLKGQAVFFYRNQDNCLALENVGSRTECQKNNRIKIGKSTEQDGSMDEYLKYWKDLIEKSNSKIIYEDNGFQVGSIISKRFVYEDKFGPKYEYVFIPGKDGIFYVVESGKFESIQLKTISTFKLIN